MPSKEQTHSNDRESAKKRPQPAPGVDRSSQGQLQPATLQQAQPDPRSLTPRDVQRLQRMVGNQAVVQLLARSARPPRPAIQPKLTVGAAGDGYEQEADRVAEQVMSMAAPAGEQHSADSRQPAVQRELEEQAGPGPSPRIESNQPGNALPRLSPSIPLIQAKFWEVEGKDKYTWHAEDVSTSFYADTGEKRWYSSWQPRSFGNEEYPVYRHKWKMHNESYKNIVHEDLPISPKEELPEAIPRVLEKESSVLSGMSPWLLKLAVGAVQRKVESSPVEVFNLYMQYLKKAGFQYFSPGDSMGFLGGAAQGNCQNLSAGLMYLGQMLGLDAGTEVVPAGFFATAKDANLTTSPAHHGNVKFAGGEYDTNRFIFSMHVVAKLGGACYDPLFNKSYGSAGEAKVWELQETLGDTLAVTQVKDGAEFPDRTPITPTNAKITKDVGKTSTEFGDYWIVTRV